MYVCILKVLNKEVLSRSSLLIVHPIYVDTSMATSSPLLLLRTSLFNTFKITSPKPFSNIIFSPSKTPQFHSKSTKMEIKAENKEGLNGKKKIFVSGATGKTGKRIVEQLLAKGFAVKAGVRDAENAKTMFKNQNQDLQIVNADVTEGPEKLANAIGDDSDAVICATGFQYSLDVLAPWKVDYYGTVNLVDACRKVGVSRFILVSSILVNGAAMGQLLNPAYIVLNAFGLVLVAKLQAEQYIRKSGFNFTIIRPGGLKNDPPSGNIVMEPEDTLSEGSISRDQVAEVAIESLLCPQSSYKVVEIVARTEAPKTSFEELFGSIKER